MPFMKSKEANRSSFGRATVRFYDVDELNDLAALFKNFSGTRNDFYNEVLKAGVKTLSKKYPVEPVNDDPAKTEHLAGRLDTIEKELLDAFAVLSAKADAASERSREQLAITSSIYNVVLCLASGEKVTVSVVEKGLFDSEPERFRKKK
jgi:hypothetical protein